MIVRQPMREPIDTDPSDPSDAAHLPMHDREVHDRRRPTFATSPIDRDLRAAPTARTAQRAMVHGIQDRNTMKSRLCADQVGADRQRTVHDMQASAGAVPIRIDQIFAV